MAINRCSNNTIISKATVKAMLQTASVVGVLPGDTVRYTDSQGHIYSCKVVKVYSTTVDLDRNGETITVPLRSVQGMSPTFFDKLDDEDWTITSFDPSTRTVCVRVNNQSSVSYLSVKLPVLTVG